MEYKRLCKDGAALFEISSAEFDYAEMGFAAIGATELREELISGVNLPSDLHHMSKAKLAVAGNIALINSLRQSRPADGIGMGHAFFASIQAAQRTVERGMMAIYRAEKAEAAARQTQPVN